MSNLKAKKTDRFLAFLLAVVMIVGMLPATVFAGSEAYPGKYTLTVTDDDGSPVQDASVSYEIKVDAAKKTDGTASTDSDGVAGIDLSDYSDEIGGTQTVTIAYSVSKSGFETAEDEITVAEAEGNTQITLRRLTDSGSTVAVTAQVSGDGTVKLNGVVQNTVSVTKGESVEIELTPAADNYIKQLTIGEEDKSAFVTKGEAYKTTIHPEEDTDISVAFMEEVTVTVEQTGSGTVLVAGTAESSRKVDIGSTLSLKVTPQDGFQIASVTIGGSSESVGNLYSFEKTFTADADTTIGVVFVKEYNVTVTYDRGKGDVTTEPTGSTISGRVEAKVGEGGSVTVTAVPNDTFRVSAVTYEGTFDGSDRADVTFDDNTYSNLDGKVNNFTKTLSNVKSDLTVTVTFAPTVFNVTVADDTKNDDKGTVRVGSAKVNYGGQATIDIILNGDYDIEEVKVNGQKAYPILVHDKLYRFAAGGIVKDTEIAVTYKDMDKEADGEGVLADIKGCLDALSPVRKDEMSGLYVYARDTESVSISTERGCIALNELTEDGNCFETTPFALTADCMPVSVEKIYIYHDNAWHIIKPDPVLRIAVDDTAPVANLTPDEADSGEWYNNSFDVSVDVTDEGDSSGIEKVEYWITGGSGGGEKIALYTYADGAEVLSSYSGRIRVDAAVNNSDHIVVHVQVTDRAGNVSEEAVTPELKVNSTPPEITVSMQDKPGRHPEAEEGYYNAARTAVVTVKDHSFNRDNMNGAIDIKANGKEADLMFVWITWSDSGDIHQATIKFFGNAEYEWNIGVYTNEAGLSAGESIPEEKVSGDDVWKFTVDTVAPTAKISCAGSTWERLLETLTFGIWKPETVTASVEDINDATSGVDEKEKVLYYKSNETEALETEELESLFSEGKFTKEKVTVSSDEVFVVYARVTDRAGNTLYLSTDGIIYDASDGVITITPGEENKSESGIYTGDVKVAVKVDDTRSVKREGIASSGIKSVTYKVEKSFSGDVWEQTVEDTALYTFNADGGEGHPTYDELKRTWDNNDKPLTVSAKDNNAPFVRVTVTVYDNAGNEYNAESVFAVSTDAPEVKVTYDGKQKDTRKDDDHYITRTATITITDRGDVFDSEAATCGLSVEAQDSKGESIDPKRGVDYSIGDWVASGKDSENERQTHTADVTFITDGNYTVNFKYKNKAGREATLSEEKFTLDNNDPRGSVTVKESVWDKLIEVLTFGLYSNESVKVTATSDDDTSETAIEYYKDNGTEALSADILESKQFEPYTDSFSVDADERFTVYLKITDYAGNYIYISSDGYIVDMKPGNIAKPVQEDWNGIYNKDLQIPVEVTDGEAESDGGPYSGIKRIDYKVIKDGDEDNPTQQGNLFNFDYVREEGEDGKNTNGGTLTVTDSAKEETGGTEKGQVPSYSQLVYSWSGVVTVDAEPNNNADSVVLVIEVEDNAGNISDERRINLSIDTTAPVIALSYPETDPAAEPDQYFNHERIATVTITEKNFDPVAATAGIRIKATNAKGDVLENDDNKKIYEIGEWTVEKGKTGDEDTHTATITFPGDANYTLNIEYTDEAHNSNDRIIKVTGVHPWEFTVDKTPPTGTIRAESAEGRKEEWGDLRSALTYGFWSREKITVTGEYDDATSLPIASVQYHKVKSEKAKDKSAPLTEDDLKKVSDWADFTDRGLDIVANEQCVIYLKITDLAGNSAYISTDGLIADSEHPDVETVAPQITVKPQQQPINEIYNTDVKVNVAVSDPVVGGTYSGLKSIDYRVLNMGTVTQSGTLYTFNEQNPTQDKLLQKWGYEDEGTGAITVDRTRNNSNDVKIEVTAQDNAGNTSTKSVTVQIDITAPRIDVRYDNNDVDSGFYFKAGRKATVTVTERNFDRNAVEVAITNSKGVIPVLSEWRQISRGTGNRDDAKWEATVLYDAEGDYTFDITCADLAANIMRDDVGYGDGEAPTRFTIDKTVPIISVDYDNKKADSQYDDYYKAERTAKVTVTEHNFNSARVNIMLTATDDGRATTLPTVSGWTSDGDVHTATIRYAADALYTFDISLTDMAGNASADFAEQKFWVDKTNPTLEITGVADKSANNGDVIPVVTFSDTNYDPDRISITLSGANRGSITTLDGSYTDVHNGQVFTFADFAKDKQTDDIYTLSAALTDKAGNSTAKSITFSVNRFGSTYTLSQETKSLNDTYVKEPRDVVITETNPNELTDITITLFKNNETITLKEGEDYRIDVTGGNGQWYQYKYTIFAKNFADDGVYRITIHSRDAAGNIAENTLDTKNTDLSFGVDKTPPTLVVTNLDDGVTYPLDKKTVKMSSDDNLLLDTVTVYLDDYDVPYKTWNVDEIANILAGDGEFRFDISGDSNKAHKVKIICADAAGNETPKEISDFFVTTNIWVRYYNNKPLFFGSIAGVVLLGALIIVFIVGKRRKNDGEVR